MQIEGGSSDDNFEAGGGHDDNDKSDDDDDVGGVKSIREFGESSRPSHDIPHSSGPSKGWEMTLELMT